MQNKNHTSDSIGMLKTIRFEFDNSIYDCDLQIKDLAGVRTYHIPVLNAEEGNDNIFETDILGDSIEITLTPVAANLSSHMNEIRSDLKQEGWKGKLLFGFLNKVLSSLDGLCLRTSCTYRISDISDNSVYLVRLSGYVHGSTIIADLFNIFPIMYMHYEVLRNYNSFEPINALALNRKDIIRDAKKLAVLDFGLHTLIMYPIKVSRAKRLTKDKKVKKTLQKFYRLTPEKRQQLFDNWDAIL